jgi:chromosomal replication initiation ATPase DnaA
VTAPPGPLPGTIGPGAAAQASAPSDADRFRQLEDRVAALEQKPAATGWFDQFVPKVLRDILTSKKALATIAGVLAVVANRFGLQVSSETTTKAVALVAAYLLAQGLADFGKERRAS